MEKFILGFIAGEGSFHTRLRQNEHSNYGVETSLEFTLLLNDRDSELLEEIHDYIGLGRIRYDDSRSTVCWKVSSKEDCKDLARFIEENAGDGFVSSEKYQSFKKWRHLLNNVDIMCRSKRGKEKFIKEAKEINSGNNGLSADEWVERLTDD